VDVKELIIPYRKCVELWDAADEIRQEAWGNQVPVNVEVIADKHFRLLPIPIPNLLHYTNSEAFLAGNLKELDYDPNAVEVRLRFSVAHELGHFHFHSQEISMLRSGSFTEWKHVIEQMPDGSWGRAEFQAREFGGRLLVSSDELIKELSSLRTKIATAKSQIDSIDSEKLAEYISPLVRKHFNVSAQVIIERIKSEKIDLLNF
jgi:hypothetical protein